MVSKPSVRFGVDWESATPDDVAQIPLFIADAGGTLHKVINGDFQTPLSLAAEYSKNGEVITALLAKARVALREMKSPVEAEAEMLRNIQGMMFSAAMDNPCPEVMQALINAGADVNECRASSTPLMRAVFSGSAEVVACLIQAGADVNGGIRYSGNETPLDIAGSRANIAKMLIDAGAVRSIDLPDKPIK